jgi:hypothetical protein
MGQTGEGEIAASDEAGHGVVGVPPVDQVELGVQRVGEVDLDEEFLAAKLAGELSQGGLVGVGGHTEGDLSAEVFGEPAFLPQRGLVVQRIFTLSNPQGATKLLGGRDLHPYQEPTTLAIASRPSLHVVREVAPAAQIEVADAEVGALANRQGPL